MIKDINLAIKMAIDKAWHPSQYKNQFGVFKINDDYQILDFEGCRKHNISMSNALFTIDGGIKTRDLSSFSLIEFCRYFNATNAQINYIYNMLVKYGDFSSDVPIKNVKCDKEVISFIAALFPNWINNFYDRLVKRAVINDAINSYQRV
ncbi:hypothetical protein FOD75_11005 (plasmid) [Limosilactobacillus reuteri]|uniref:Uncharacterized protein n=1 Tax=Limosilactobacillus reuteri TaxID=1598 RepID=A0A517D8K6_LIMRT|nr:hypothetical protein [Limosilactobacillus reuteri]QDR73617.1 hypothetical protein FOD75_11005 [Limosilactobacillus reuteri]